MPVDIFLKLSPIKGESQDDKHKDEIDVSSFSFGQTNDGTAFKSGELAAEDFSFAAPISRASPLLFLAVATGEHFKEAIITVRKPSAKEPLEFLKWTLTDVILTSAQEGAASGTEVNDAFSLAFAKIEVEYKLQKADGTFGESVNAGWELKR
jgi:type VI secretion system secreted protein Hcp